jgi:hypothetical protein
MKKTDTQFLIPTKQTELNNTKEHSNAHKNTFKEEILQVITNRISWRRY